jgi:hypothetical protein
MLHLIRTIKKGDRPEGYDMHMVNGSKTTHSLQGCLAVTLRQVYEGLNFNVEVFEVKNRRAAPLTLEERGFYQPGVRAISLDALQIPPFRTTHLYRIVHHDA